jgi:hypothetical protein
VAQGLSFDEVRHGTAVAWHPAGYLFLDGRLLRIAADCEQGSEIVLRSVRPSTLHGSEDHIQSGWRHLDDCDCEGCRSAE